MKKKACLECKTLFEGRLDKKYCSDPCRIAYHNRIKTAHNKSIKEINSVLRSNFNLLKKLSQSDKKRITRSELMQEGFDFNYFTNTYTTQNGNVYYYCYEYGYRFLNDEDEILVVKKF